MIMPSSAQIPAEDSADEQIDVVRIRLSTPAHTTALLSEYRSADRVLASWACNQDCNPVDFEITYFDGYVMRGCYEFFKRGKLRRSFSAHVRRLLRQAAPVQDLSRYVAPV